jgi:hypothetical protein
MFLEYDSFHFLSLSFRECTVRAPGMCTPRHVCPSMCASGMCTRHVRLQYVHPACAPEERTKLLTPGGMGEWMEHRKHRLACACVLRMCASAMPTSFHTLPVQAILLSSEDNVTPVSRQPFIVKTDRRGYTIGDASPTGSAPGPHWRPMAAPRPLPIFSSSVSSPTRSSWIRA